MLAKIIEEEMEKSVPSMVGEVVTRTLTAELGNRLGSSVSHGMIRCNIFLGIKPSTATVLLQFAVSRWETLVLLVSSAVAGRVVD